MNAVNLFVTDFATTKLHPAFVKQAAAKWPGGAKIHATGWDGEPYSYWQPNWSPQVFPAIERLAKEAYMAGGELTHLNSLDAIG